ncbi:hypothetical protein Tco_0567030 [Tanacetum coccineum]
MNPLSNHSYGFTHQFFAQSPHTPNTSKKDFDFDKILDDLFRTGAKNMKRTGQYIVQDSIWEHDDDLEEAREDDAPATKSILDELLEEFRDEILNVTMVDEDADFNPTKDLEELERLLAKEP